MTERLPIFPLGAVLFPGLVLPLHIFEDRYRALVSDLQEIPEGAPRRFGVVTIELGHEVARGTGDPVMGGAQRLAPVGCVADLHQIDPQPDGRFNVIAVGRERFLLGELDTSGPYLVADVTVLPDRPIGTAQEAAGLAATRVTALLHRYVDGLRGHGAQVTGSTDLPDDPIELSYLVAASLMLDRRDKLRLLACDNALTRLRLEYDILVREIKLLDVLPTVPATELLEGEIGPN